MNTGEQAKEKLSASVTTGAIFVSAPLDPLCSPKKEASPKVGRGRIYNEAYHRIYRYAHKDKIREYKKKWHQVNKERLKKQRKEYWDRYNQNNKERRKDYNEKNKERISKRANKYYQSNKEQIKNRSKNDYYTNKEQRRNSYREYYQTHKEQAREYVKNKLKIDINYRISSRLRIRINKILRNKSKSAHTMELLGCSIVYLKQHLENQFKRGMSWENYGLWHIDHRLPCVGFNLTDPKEQRKCFNYSNLQPLWAKENLSKGRKKYVGK